ncbi:hypothetical protein PPBDW_II0116 [Photobacterium kishitanii]|nr:hypothetical protein PPBDW_II0116 [Photobacterium kishitanii]
MAAEISSTSEFSTRQYQIAVALYADPQDMNIEQTPTLKSIRHGVSHDFFDGNDYIGQDVLNLLALGGWKGGRIDDDCRIALEWEAAINANCRYFTFNHTLSLTEDNYNLSAIGDK